MCEGNFYLINTLNVIFILHTLKLLLLVLALTIALL